MATVSTVQRSAAMLSAIRTPARRVLSPALRAISTRGLATTTRPRVPALTYKIPTSFSYPSKSVQLQKRQNSNDSNSLRNWGFEEVRIAHPQVTIYRESNNNQINASLPSESGSPTHKPILVDVREPAELQGTGIIPSAISIPFASQPDAMFLTPDEFETRFGFPKPEPVDGAQMIFYCKAGVRAKAMAQMAVQAGYDPSTVGYYWGSWLDWERNGGKVERWEGDD
ncbi:unnamed protein product [Penicillium salamii]|uniref:Rhodanese domain-containing protein n=1 Tax=Penicillium salamii TaxID=1612424 RepID=A0A9W4NAW8_9EURO|nr:unnamed protein product [Penicillium salamii]CAG8044575.1 unnamed protein product [Penicillium salamii]CAG8338579.1 unnamed protein product [Penicillium salamii]CAG8346115.1 unnamed protein product [Penicillium salamii]CAG8346119.1 unnamed protein product [Penicillium salamii]